MKKATKKTGAMKRVAPKKVRKFEEGGINSLKPKTSAEAVKGLVIGTVATAQTAEEQAKSAKDLLTVSKPTSSTPKKKLLPGGFESEAQKAAYIKNVKNKIAKGATIEQLVKDKVGTRAGLEGLGFKDTPSNEKKSVKKTTTTRQVLPKNNVLSSVGRKGQADTASTPLPKDSKVPLKTPYGKRTAPQLKVEGIIKKIVGKVRAEQGRALKKEGARQAKAYQKQVVDTKSTYGNRVGKKDVATTVSTRRDGTKLVKVTSVDAGSTTGKGWKSSYKEMPASKKKTKLPLIYKKGGKIKKE